MDVVLFVFGSIACEPEQSPSPHPLLEGLFSGESLCSGSLHLLGAMPLSLPLCTRCQPRRLPDTSTPRRGTRRREVQRFDVPIAVASLSRGMCGAYGAREDLASLGLVRGIFESTLGLLRLRSFKDLGRRGALISVKNCCSRSSMQRRS